MIYLDNAATTMHKPQEMIEAVVHAMGSLGNAGRGANTRLWGRQELSMRQERRLARLFGADEPKTDRLYLKFYRRALIRRSGDCWDLETM